jgi:hypothetical protein
MRHVATEASIRRLGVRKRREQLRHSGALKHLLEEFALWTALWTGFPLYDDPDLAQAGSSSSGGEPGVESGGKSMTDGDPAAKSNQPRARAQ